MVRKFLKLEFALLLSVLALVGQIVWPQIESWMNRPIPGKQVAVQNGNLRYLLYLPEGHRSREAWPLLVFLHGSGNRGYDLEALRGQGPARLINNGKSLPFIVATPQCNPREHWRPEHVEELIKDLDRRYIIKKIYLTGYSMGGYGTWAAAAQFPERFAAIAPVCGLGDLSKAELFVDLPIWAFHGDKDEVVPLEPHRELIDAINDAGGRAKLTIYDSAGHGISQRTYANPDLYTWFLSHE